jgi:UDP-glucose 4-epimerase
VDGTIAAAFYPGQGEVFNLGGGSEVSVLHAIALVEKISGRKTKLKRLDRQKGDVRHTKARLDRAKSKLGYSPKVGLEQGLTEEWNWIRALQD